MFGSVGTDSAVSTNSAIGQILVGAEDLDRRIAELGAEISRDYEGKDLLLVAILKGAVLFLSDLLRRIEIPAEVDFMAVASYGNATKSSGVVQILKDLEEPIEGRDVLIIEDIVDTGLTLRYLRRSLEARGPASLEVCTLLARESADLEGLGVRYVGFTIPGDFVVGYGLDAVEKYRNLRYLAVYEPDGD